MAENENKSTVTSIGILGGETAKILLGMDLEDTDYVNMAVSTGNIIDTALGETLDNISGVYGTGKKFVDGSADESDYLKLAESVAGLINETAGAFATGGTALYTGIKDINRKQVGMGQTESTVFNISALATNIVKITLTCLKTVGVNIATAIGATFALVATGIGIVLAVISMVCNIKDFLDTKEKIKKTKNLCYYLYRRIKRMLLFADVNKDIYLLETKALAVVKGRLEEMKEYLRNQEVLPEGMTKKFFIPASFNSFMLSTNILTWIDLNQFFQTVRNGTLKDYVEFVHIEDYSDTHKIMEQDIVRLQTFIDDNNIDILNIFALQLSILKDELEDRARNENNTEWTKQDINFAYKCTTYLLGLMENDGLLDNLKEMNKISAQNATVVSLFNSIYKYLDFGYAMSRNPMKEYQSLIQVYYSGQNIENYCKNFPEYPLYLFKTSFYFFGNILFNNIYINNFKKEISARYNQNIELYDSTLYARIMNDIALYSDKFILYRNIITLREMLVNLRNYAFKKRNNYYTSVYKWTNNVLELKNVADDIKGYTYLPIQDILTNIIEQRNNMPILNTYDEARDNRYMVDIRNFSTKVNRKFMIPVTYTYQQLWYPMSGRLIRDGKNGSYEKDSTIARDLQYILDMTDGISSEYNFIDYWGRRDDYVTAVTGMNLGMLWHDEYRTNWDYMHNLWGAIQRTDGKENLDVWLSNDENSRSWTNRDMVINEIFKKGRYGSGTGINKYYNGLMSIRNEFFYTIDKTIQYLNDKEKELIASFENVQIDNPEYDAILRDQLKTKDNVMLWNLYKEAKALLYSQLGFYKKMEHIIPVYKRDGNNIVCTNYQSVWDILYMSYERTSLTDMYYLLNEQNLNTLFGYADGSFKNRVSAIDYYKEATVDYYDIIFKNNIELEKIKAEMEQKADGITYDKLMKSIEQEYIEDQIIQNNKILNAMGYQSENEWIANKIEEEKKKNEDIIAKKKLIKTGIGAGLLAGLYMLLERK